MQLFEKGLYNWQVAELTKVLGCAEQIGLKFFGLQAVYDSHAHFN